MHSASEAIQQQGEAQAKSLNQEVAFSVLQNQPPKQQKND